MVVFLCFTPRVIYINKSSCCQGPSIWEQNIAHLYDSTVSIESKKPTKCTSKNRMVLMNLINRIQQTSQSIFNQNSNKFKTIRLRKTKNLKQNITFFKPNTHPSKTTALERLNWSHQSQPDKTS